MQVTIVRGHHPPPNPQGITVVIDVIRACTTCHEAFARGARRIYPVAEPAEGLALRTELPDALLAGEVDALPIAGFDMGNSPWQMRHAAVAGRDVILRSTNGVAAALAARDSAGVLLAGLVNAAATARWLRDRAPPAVLLVASHPTGDEDFACAEYIRGLLGGRGIPLAEAAARTRGAQAAGKFLRGWRGLHPEDIAIAAGDAGSAAFVMQVRWTPRAVIEAC